MQSEPLKTSKSDSKGSSLLVPESSHQHGLHQLQQDGTGRDCSAHCSSRGSPQSVRGSSSHKPAEDGEGVDADLLEQRLCGLSDGSRPGQRISEYENALTPSTPRQALGFKVIKRRDGQTDGTQLTDFPNEILTHILSHLHPDSHSAVALVSKRFYKLVMDDAPWRIAFQRYFPGRDALKIVGKNGTISDQDDAEFIRFEVRHFNRLTAHASWRNEYLLRNRLLRSLARGRPGTSSGGIGSSSRNSQSGKKFSAVLTYNSKLPSMVTNIHASFSSSGRKGPRVIHAAADMCVGSASDPTTGKVEKWGLDDPFALAQLDEVVPHLLPYGIGEGPAAVPNVMDVSQPFGLVGGEGFPGGRVFFRPSGEFRGKYLGSESSVVDAHPDIPKIPELSEAICSLWIAKSPAVPSLTQSVVGVLSGSTLGVVTAYALGHDSSGPRYINGEISARWVISPGVPIIAIKVDESYSAKRKAAGRVWAVALNALGEVYYLTQTPEPPAKKSKTDDSTKCAWITGRSVYWHLIESTRRQPRPDEADKNAIRGAYSPRSPSNSMNLKKDQMIAEAREIEKFLRYKPAHFRKVCDGWDMRRRLEVDFASDNDHGAGENIFVISCGLEEGHTSSILRFSRTSGSRDLPETQTSSTLTPTTQKQRASSLFGGGGTRTPSPDASGSPLLKQVLAGSGRQSPDQGLTSPSGTLDDWRETKFSLDQDRDFQITASAVDCSLCGLMASFEDPLKAGPDSSTAAPVTPHEQSFAAIPGRRARMLGIGTNSGAVLLWNMREGHSDGVRPIRIIQTESPEVSCLAMTALYVVHGGKDGLVQAWDPLASSLDPIRTLNSRSSSRVPRHMININPALIHVNFSAVGAIYLDPDATVLRGIVAFGTFIRYWAYSSSGQPAGRKRRVRHSDIHGRTASRRNIGGVKGYIAAEAEELRREQEHNAQEQARLRARFGVGLGDLTEEEALRYAEMISQESFLIDEQRRTSASDTGSAADFDTTSTTGSLDTVTPDPSVSGFSPPAAASSASVHANANAAGDESDYELQIQQAIRLSLLEGVDDMGQSPRGNSSGDYEFPMAYKEKRVKRSPHNTSPRSSQIPVVQHAESSTAAVISPDMDEDFQLALRLSLTEEECRKSRLSGLGILEDEFPALGAMEKGKGKGKAF